MAAQTVKQAFDAFNDELNLDPKEREEAQERHGEVTEVLAAAGLIATTFLQGSFARKTMRKPLKDVDMVIVLHESCRDEWFGAGKGGPAAAMAAIEAAIREKWADTEFDAEKAPPKALQVTFADCRFTFDLVPAFEDLDGTEVFIGNRKTDEWEWSNTRALRNLITERNLDTKGVFVRQVRMAKTFKDNNAAISGISSLAIESFCYKAVTRKTSHAEALADTFEHAAAAVLQPVYDPTGVDELSTDWTDNDRRTYAAAFSAAATQAREAIDLAGDDEHGTAIDIWRAVLGDPFPQPEPQTEDEVFAAAPGGSISSTGRVVTSVYGVQPNRPVRSWRTR
ncbi:nucleotidyltransferase [Glycomyces sp. NPDC049804]|uniref:nucleotidyltransferase n=1 Tax=Glycomyces sp. NPDC049804 TaxID=3154363 RepID=UPI0034221DFC